MNEPLPTDPVPCSVCGAEPKGDQPVQERCWLCGADLRPLPAHPAAESPARSAPTGETPPEGAPEPVSPAGSEAEPPNPFTSYPPESPGDASARRPQFGLATLLGMMTLTAVWLGVTVVEPGIGIVAAIVLAPALVRSAVQTARARQAGYQLVAADKFAFFLTSIGIVLLTGIAGIGAFFSICVTGVITLNGTRIFSGEQTLIALLMFSTLVGLVAGGWVFWKFWPRLPTK